MKNWTEELGYSRYDYRNRIQITAGMVIPHKKLHTSYGDMELDIPRDRKGEFEPQIIKKYQIYSYNAESFNPNMDAQYLRARYYSVKTAGFISEDSYLGDITDPLTLNRYNYVKEAL